MGSAPGPGTPNDELPVYDGSPKTPGQAVPLPSDPLEGPDSADFFEALQFTLKNEGGFSDHPDDRGGPTKFGITIGDYSEYLGRKATREEVKLMALAEAGEIYKKKYWDKLNLDLVIDTKAATVIFDMGVLCGTGTSAKWVQEICGTKIDGKIGPVTLGALNTMQRAVFIPKFADRAEKYFRAIVASRPSQGVFLKGWLNRADRLRTLAGPDEGAVASPEAKEPGKAGEGLVDLAIKKGLRPEPIARMVDFWRRTRPMSNPTHWAFFDTTLHSSKKRFFVLNTKTMEVESFHAAHGSGSDTNHDGMLDKFSNEPGSNCTSKGIYRCAETYVGSNGRSLKLDGLETTNNNARKRYVVIHGAGYVGEKYVSQYGKCGRSQGCPALDKNLAQEIINKLVGGSPLIIA